MEPTIYKPSIYKGAGIYKIGAEGGKPSDIQEISNYFEKCEKGVFQNDDYNRSYVSESFSSDYNFKIEVNFTNDPSSDNSNVYFLNQKNGGICLYTNMQPYTNNRRIYGSNGTYSVALITTLNEGRTGNFLFELDKNKLKINGVEYNINYASISLTDWYLLPGANTTPYHQYSGGTFLKRLTISNGNNVLFDKISVKRKKDNVFGLLDIVEGSFLSRGASGQ